MLAELGPWAASTHSQSSALLCPRWTPGAPACRGAKITYLPPTAPSGAGSVRARHPSPAPLELPAAGSSRVRPADRARGARQAGEHLPGDQAAPRRPGRGRGAGRPLPLPVIAGVAAPGSAFPASRLPPRPPFGGQAAARAGRGRWVRRPSKPPCRWGWRGLAGVGPAAADGGGARAGRTPVPRPPGKSSRPSSRKSSWTTTR